MSKHIVKDAPVGSFLSLLQPAAKTPVLGRVARTSADIERIKEEAYRAAYAQGYEAGHAEGVPRGYEDGQAAGLKMAYDEAAQRIQELLDALSASVNNALQEWFRQSEPRFAELSTLIASRILARELSLSDASILAMAREAVAEVTHATHARIRLHPLDIPIVEEHKADVLAASASLRDFEIVEDASIPGGCVIDTDGGVVDARLDEKIFEVLEAIRTRLRVEA